MGFGSNSGNWILLKPPMFYLNIVMIGFLSKGDSKNYEIVFFHFGISHTNFVVVRHDGNILHNDSVKQCL